MASSAVCLRPLGKGPRQESRLRGAQVRLVDQEIVRELAESQDPGAFLVFTHGDCVVASVEEEAAFHSGMVIARRYEIEDELTGGPLSEERLNVIAHRWDNRARDIGS